MYLFVKKQLLKEALKQVLKVKKPKHLYQILGSNFLKFIVTFAGAGMNSMAVLKTIPA